MNWNAASPLMTMALARFQSRPEKLSSTKPRITVIRSKASFIVSEPSVSVSRSMKAFL